MNLLRKRELVKELTEAEARRHLRKVAAADDLYHALKRAVDFISDPRAKALAEQTLKRVDSL